MTFLQLCASLDHLSRENNIDPPKMTLTFGSEIERLAFRGVLSREFSDMTRFVVTNPAQAKVDRCHGIEFDLQVKGGSKVVSQDGEEGMEGYEDDAPGPPAKVAVSQRLTAEDLRRGMRMLKDNEDWRSENPWVLYKHELSVLGYEDWASLKPGQQIKWNGQPIIVAGVKIPEGFAANGLNPAYVHSENDESGGLLQFATPTKKPAIYRNKTGLVTTVNHKRQ